MNCLLWILLLCCCSNKNSNGCYRTSMCNVCERERCNNGCGCNHNHNHCNEARPFPIFAEERDCGCNN